MENPELNKQKEFTIRWFQVVCDSCGWSWFESEQMRKSPYFYCPKCLSKIKNEEKKQKKKLAKKSELILLKKHFDQFRLDSL